MWGCQLRTALHLAFHDAQCYKPQMTTTTTLTTVLPVDERVDKRLKQLTAELLFAWDHSDSSILAQWAVGAANTFGTALKRRASNLLGLVIGVAKGTWQEADAAVTAFRDDRLGAHVGGRAEAAYNAGVDFAARVKIATTTTAGLLRTNPREALPQLLTLVATSALVSGGPDGDGGAPDLDLMFGIGAHRSILSHSVLLGAALETAFLSLVTLVQVLHAKLPERHDPVWDTLALHADSIAHAASTGASLGMSYHLLVDGLLQPAAYHDLPVSLPIEAHQGIFIGNGVAEAIDTQHKPLTRTGPRQMFSLGPREAEDDNSEMRQAGGRPSSPISKRSADNGVDAASTLHRRYLSESYLIDPFIADMLSNDELLLLERYGCWMEALISGEIPALTPAQTRFIDVAHGRRSPATTQECAWHMYKELVKLSPQS